MQPDRPVLFVAAFALLTSACARGYKSAEDLESDRRGPGACDQSCRELGMQMTGFVLVEHGTSGCVCSPVGPSPVPGHVGAAAASHVLLEQQRQQQQQQQQYRPPPR